MTGTETSSPMGNENSGASRRPLFSSQVEFLSIRELADRVSCDGPGRILLPPIQRSLVWNNTRIVNFWDSLLRGYPAGLFMVHAKNGSAEEARNQEGETVQVREDDWLLFDGQQRVASILLGLGEGGWASTRKLWVDLGSDAKPESDLRFQLRISSIGQPFGYRPEAPDQKIESGKRRDKWDELKKRGRTSKLQDVFFNSQGSDLIDAKCAIPLCELYRAIESENGAERLAADLQSRGADPDTFHAVTMSMRDLRDSIILVKKIDDKILSDENDYVRFFSRLGQGGVALTNDELTYSLIKRRYPGVHKALKDVSAESGRLSSEVNVVISCLRLSKVNAPCDGSKLWEIIGRPDPRFVKELQSRWQAAERSFENLLQIGLESKSPVKGGTLSQICKDLRGLLDFKPENSYGIPAMLMARLPSPLVDVLLLFLSTSEPKQLDHEVRLALQAFVLHWLLFVTDDDKAASEAFRRVYSTKNSGFSADRARSLVSLFETEGIARPFPRRDELTVLKQGAERPRPLPGILRAWSERFTEADRTEKSEKGGSPGEALRVLTTNPELIRRALMWVQRQYLAERGEDFDPTSGRDEDLPFDLDHLIPQGLFGEHWSTLCGKVRAKTEEENFRWRRHIIGNSLGNYRWLLFPENRSRQKGPIEHWPDKSEHDLSIGAWNGVIVEYGDKWPNARIEKFQELIDRRSLACYEIILSFFEVALVVGAGAPPLQR